MISGKEIIAAPGKCRTDLNLQLPEILHQVFSEKSNNSILPEKRKDNADDFLCNHVRFYQEFFDSDVTEPAQASEMPADEI